MEFQNSDVKGSLSFFINDVATTRKTWKMIKLGFNFPQWTRINSNRMRYRKLKTNTNKTNMERKYECILL